jgi:hypothetical protein
MAIPISAGLECHTAAEGLLVPFQESRLAAAPLWIVMLCLRPTLICVACHGHCALAVVVVASVHRIRGARPCTAVRQNFHLRTTPMPTLGQAPPKAVGGQINLASQPAARRYVRNIHFP